MATVTRTVTFSSGDVLTAANLNAEFNNLLNALALVNADISSGANITASKLDTTVVETDTTQTISGVKTFSAAPVMNIGLSTNVRARAKRTTGQTISNATSTKIQFNTEDYDPGSNYDNATNYRFTASLAGYYLMSANVTFTGNNTGLRQIAIAVNGTNVAEIDTGPGQAFVIQGGGNLSNIHYLALNDYIEVFVYQNSGGNLDTAQPTFLSVHLLSV